MLLRYSFSGNMRPVLAGTGSIIIQAILSFVSMTCSSSVKSLYGSTSVYEADSSIPPSDEGTPRCA